ncbi:MAG: DUF3604 domain-containing protein [Pseudomonadota bacterium]
MKKIVISLSCALALLVLAFVAWTVMTARIATPLVVGPALPAPLPAPDRPAGNPLKDAYFGELHLHTSYSMDANLFGTRNDPRMAYRFARGEEVEIPETGLRQRIVEPLDFTAVTDHAEGLGMYGQCTTPGSGRYWSIDCIGLRYQVLLVFPRLFKALQQSGAQKAHYPDTACGDDGRLCIAAAKSVWQDTQNAANEFYQPGKFTTFVGFEYSPTLANGGMMHRNVIFRSSKVPDNVFSGADGFAEDLLRWLDTQCGGDCRAMSIPHNPNFSWGLMFGERNSDATPVTRENLLLRARYERLIEIFQAKGSSECARGLDNNDEQCGFENFWPVCTAAQLAVDAKTGQHGQHCVASNDMVRGVLRRGLQQQGRLGFNPYKFGFVGGTDNHNGTPGDTSENTYKGHGGSNDATPQRRLGLESTPVTRTLGIKGYEINPGGLTGVWAEENTRESIWDGLYRRESWGTSGTRIRLRVFGGYDFAAGFHLKPDLLKAASATGVPMGADLGAAPTGNAPSFVVWAMRDANSAPLQRLQIIKGWSSGGQTQERVYDLACGDGKGPDAHTHRCAESALQLDLSSCKIAQDQGAGEMAATWTDPQFEAGQAAFYYVRVLESPVCRYSQYDANALKVAHPVEVPSVIQERAWSSPIWYTPK